VTFEDDVRSEVASLPKTPLLAGYGNTGYGQQVAQQGYGNYAAQGAQAGWTPQQQLWAQQWQQYYQQQAAAQRK